MKFSLKDSFLELLMWGVLLALLKLVYLFFDQYNILDFIVFLVAGIIINKKYCLKKWALGVFLSFPAVILSCIFLIKIGYDELSEGVGISFLSSLIIMPLATLLGFFIGKKIFCHAK